MRPAAVPLVIGVVLSLCAAAAGAPPTSRPARPARPTTVPVDKRKPYVHAPSGGACPWYVSIAGCDCHPW